MLKLCPINSFSEVLPELPVIAIVFILDVFLTIAEHLVSKFNEFFTLILFLFIFPNFLSIIAIFAPLFNASSANLLPSIFFPLIPKNIVSFFTSFEFIDTELIFFFFF